MPGLAAKRLNAEAGPTARHTWLPEHGADEEVMLAATSLRACACECACMCVCAHMPGTPSSPERGSLCIEPLCYISGPPSAHIPGMPSWPSAAQAMRARVVRGAVNAVGAVVIVQQPQPHSNSNRGVGRRSRP